MSEPTEIKTIESILAEIQKVTLLMETKYPELYRYLEETPLLAKNIGSAQLTVEDFANYLETIKGQLKRYIEIHS
ncbi:MAG: hypothetical protein SH856_12460 [Flavobacteriales bacterium]|nr:hypothetical protein [Flavobacteriales bacterium]